MDYTACGIIGHYHTASLVAHELRSKNHGDNGWDAVI